MTADIRIRFDDVYSDLIDELRQLDYFVDLGSITLFAGALGYSNKVSRTARGTRDVRLNVLGGTPGAHDFMNAIYLINPINAEVLDPLSKDSEPERAKYLEGFVNGGLQLLNDIRLQGKPMSIAVPELINLNFSKAGK